MRRALPVVLALLLVLAGCSGLGGQSADPTTTGDETTAPNATERPTDTTTETTQLASAEAVRADTLAALDAVETYRVTANQTSRVSGNVQRTVHVNSTGVFDRTAREARLDQSQQGAGVSVDSVSYLVDQTLYQRSPTLARQYDSNWVAIDASENYSRFWDQYDTLTRQRELLNVSSVSLDGTETVDGQEAYVLEAEATDEQFERLGVNVTRQGLDVSNVSATFYVDVETNRLVASTTNIDARQTLNGQTVAIEQRLDLRFDDYDAPVSIDLPSEAEETAVSIGNQTSVGA
ncbi:DUF6612 family protein [Halomarina salina]|uniref:DUF6612 family protein n=1 Tax=Halomarina salina TaxID=1872699 RepID=A0ABD5RJD4_9EURY|nr:hypothetical protein [Halomarina salina]